MKDGAPQLHEDYPNNILKHTSIRKGNYEEAIKEPGLIKVEGWYDTPTVPVSYTHLDVYKRQPHSSLIRGSIST